MSSERKEPTFGVADAYQPPAANLEFATHAATDAVAIRQAHIGHERQLKAVGLLFGLGAVAMTLSLVAIVIPGLSRASEGANNAGMIIGMAAFIGALVVVLGALAYGYRTLSPWVKYVGTPVSILGLLGIPIGTLIHGYILYLIWCEKGRRVLSDDYAAIIRATPDVRYKRTVGDSIALGVLVTLVVFFIGFILYAVVTAP